MITVNVEEPEAMQIAVGEVTEVKANNQAVLDKFSEDEDGNLFYGDDRIASVPPGGIAGSEEFKTALLNCFAHVAWIDTNGQKYYDALHAALNNAGTGTGGGESGGGESGGGESGGGESGGGDTPVTPGGDATAWVDGEPYEIVVIEGEVVDNNTGNIRPPTSSNWGRTDYLPCLGASTITHKDNTYSSS